MHPSQLDMLPVVDLNAQKVVHVDKQVSDAIRGIRLNPPLVRRVGPHGQTPVMTHL